MAWYGVILLMDKIRLTTKDDDYLIIYREIRWFPLLFATIWGPRSCEVAIIWPDINGVIWGEITSYKEGHNRSSPAALKL